MGILIIIILNLLIFIYVGFVATKLHKESMKIDSQISFREGLELTELPICTFYCNKKPLHFLLDTGSNISYINLGEIESLPHQKLNKISSTIGAGNANMDTSHVELTISYKKYHFTEEFGVLDLRDAFSSIEKESGVKIHGILGNKFFQKYKYILDFNKLIAYR